MGNRLLALISIGESYNNIILLNKSLGEYREYLFLTSPCSKLPALRGVGGGEHNVFTIPNCGWGWEAAERGVDENVIRIGQQYSIDFLL